MSTLDLTDDETRTSISTDIQIWVLGILALRERINFARPAAGPAVLRLRA
jgi:hypothetical protein